LRETLQWTNDPSIDATNWLFQIDWSIAGSNAKMKFAKYKPKWNVLKLTAVGCVPEICGNPKTKWCFKLFSDDYGCVGLGNMTYKWKDVDCESVRCVFVKKC